MKEVADVIERHHDHHRTPQDVDRLDASAHAFRIVCTYAGFKGSRRAIFPVASKSAAAMAGAAMAFAASDPPPYAPTSGRFSSTTLISGMSAILRIGYLLQSLVVIPLSSNVASSSSAWLIPITVPPSTCRFSCIGLTTMPGSTAMVAFSTLIAPVPGVTAISHTQAQ